MDFSQFSFFLIPTPTRFMWVWPIQFNFFNSQFCSNLHQHFSPFSLYLPLTQTVSDICNSHMFPRSVFSGFKSNHQPQTSSQFGSNNPTFIILGGKYNLKYAGVNQKHANSHLASSKSHSHRYTDDFNSLLIFKETVVADLESLLLFSANSLFYLFLLCYPLFSQVERERDIMGPLNRKCLRYLTLQQAFCQI